MFFTAGTPKSLSELAVLQGAIATRRREAKVLVIDDQGFGYKDILTTHHFRVHHVFDIEDIRSVAEYEVVACDIKGVGKRFHSKHEGAHIIGEIKRTYPHKILVAFSTHNFDATFNQFLKLCDHVTPKDIDSDAWVALLDEATVEAVDPIFQWKRMRDYLLEKDTPLLTVLQLEQDYIRGLLEKDAKLFPRSSATTKLPQDLRAVLQGFAGNLLFKIIIG